MLYLKTQIAKERFYMKSNFKYLALSILIPLSAMASKPAHDELINTNGLSVAFAFPISCKDNSPFPKSPTSPQYAQHPIYSWNGQSEKTDQPKTAIVLVKTQKFSVLSLQPQPEFYHFKDARHLWCLHGESGRNRARPSLYHFFEQVDSKRLSIAKHFLQLGNLQDKQFAKHYFETVYLDKDHKDHFELKELLVSDTYFRNQFGNIIFKYFT